MGIPFRATVLVAHLTRRQPKKFFIDDPLLKEAIETNDPEKVSELTDSFFTNANGQISQIYPPLGEYLQREEMRYICSSYSRFISEVNGGSMKFFSDDRGFLNSEKDIGDYEKIVITIQLSLWSRISFECFKWICIAAVHCSMMNNDIGDRELWSWLHSFTTCVSCSTSYVYDMNATVSEKKNPSCQVLLLSDSIPLFLCLARQLTNSRDRIRSFKIVTSHFSHHVQAKGKETVLFSRSDQSLNFFWNYRPDLWECLTKTFSKLAVEADTNIICDDDPEKDVNLSPQVHDTASVLVSCNMETQQAVRTVNTTTDVIAPDQINDAVSASQGSHPSFFASVPLVTEENYQILRCQLVKMKKQFNRTCGIIDVLGHHYSTSIEDKSNSYLQRCDEFCHLTFQADAISRNDPYLAKMVAYSGLVIHDIVGIEQTKNLSVHQNVFAHVLSYCLDGSFDDKRKIDWKIFFGKLLPRSAFSADVVNNPNCNFLLHNLLLYYKKCFNSMKIEPPEGNQLDYYYEQNYLPAATKKVAESNGNAVHFAILSCNSGKGQSLGEKTTHKQSKASPGGKEQPTKKEVTKKHHIAKIGLDGSEKRNEEKKGAHKQSKASPGRKEQPTKKEVTKKQHNAEIGLDGSEKRNEEKKGALYLSPSGKGIRTSLRTSPRTKFFTPSL